MKEDLIDDKAALSALINLAKELKSTVLYGVLTTLCNLTNSYEKQEVNIESEHLSLSRYILLHIAIYTGAKHTRIMFSAIGPT